MSSDLDGSTYRRGRLNVLCLDGGGIRGYSSLLILKEILKSFANGSETLPLPSTIFDIICGTSTGGLIALMLTRMGMSVDDAINEYERLSPAIFERGGKLNAWCRTVLGHPIHKASTFESKVKDLIKDRLGDNPDALLVERREDDSDALSMKSSNSSECRGFVVATSRINWSPKLLRTYSINPRDDLSEMCKVWEAARATTAAPFYFNSIKIGSHELLDGGVSGANNPSLWALVEASRLFPHRSITCFVSIGTGTPTVKRVGADSAQLKVAKTLLLNSLDCERPHEIVAHMFQNHGWSTYFRFSAPEVGNFALDAHKRLRESEEYTAYYLEKFDTKQKIEECSRKLSNSH